MRTHKPKQLIALLLLLAVAALGVLAGCGGQKAADTPAAGTDSSSGSGSEAPAAQIPEGYVDTAKYKKAGPWKIAHASQGPTNSWALMYDAHFEWAMNEKYKGQFSDFFYADANGNADKQVNDVEDLIAQKPDLLVVTPMGAAALTGVVEKAMEMGIPVILGSATIQSDEYVSLITRSNYEHGRRQAEWLAKELNHKGNIIMLSGIAGISVAEDRLQAARDVFAKYPDIKILAHAYADWSPVKGKQVTEQFIAAHPQIDGVWSDSGFMAIGTIQAFAEAGKPIPPMTGEPINGFLKLAKQHNVKFYAVGYPNAMAVDIVDTAVKVLSGEPVPKVIEVDVVEVDHTQVDKYVLPDMPDDLWLDYKFPKEYLTKLGFQK